MSLWLSSFFASNLFVPSLFSAAVSGTITWAVVSLRDEKIARQSMTICLQKKADWMSSWQRRKWPPKMPGILRPPRFGLRKRRSKIVLPIAWQSSENLLLF